MRISVVVIPEPIQKQTKKVKESLLDMLTKQEEKVVEKPQKMYWTE